MIYFKHFWHAWGYTGYTCMFSTTYRLETIYTVHVISYKCTWIHTRQNLFWYNVCTLVTHCTFVATSIHVFCLFYTSVQGYTLCKSVMIQIYMTFYYTKVSTESCDILPVCRYQIVYQIYLLYGLAKCFLMTPQLLYHQLSNLISTMYKDVNVARHSTWTYIKNNVMVKRLLQTIFSLGCMGNISEYFLLPRGQFELSDYKK